MRRKSDRHRDSTEYLNTSMQHRLIRETKRGKEDSAVGCHFGRRDFGSRELPFVKFMRAPFKLHATTFACLCRIGVIS
eukprot:scaffold16041_cov24-Attheya_sp.AAC.1